MNPRRIADHIRGYPRWYAAGLTWMVLMVALPAVGVEILPAFAASAPDQPAQTIEAGVAAPATTSATTPARVPLAPSTATFSSPAPTAPAMTSTDEAPPAETAPPETVPPEEVPPGLFDPVFDAVPGLPAVDTPEELMPLLRAVAPIATNGCTATGLTAIVLAVVAPSVQGVPLERILPYLAPVTSACANFPIPKTHTVCALDEPFVFDLGGLAESPPVIGVGIDTIEAFETEITQTYGVPFPRISGTLREMLDCEIVTD